MTISPHLQGAAALGQWARRARKAQGLTLQTLSDRAGLGLRFLSEFERGKETAELGKALAALDALGLKLLPAPDGCPIQDPVGGISSTAAVAPALVETRDSGVAPPPASISVVGPRPAAGGDTARLWDMRVALGDAREILSVCSAEPALHQSTVLKRALERCFDVMGEAARRVTPQSQARFQRIQWRAIITRRNGLVMNYEHVDHGVLFRAARDELPELETELQAALVALNMPVAGRTSRL